MREELVALRHELGRLGRLVTPLMSIAELSLVSKRVNDSQALSDGGFSKGSALNMSAEEKEKALSKLNPQLVLNNLAEFINTRELPNKRVQQIDRRFISKDEFAKFKTEVAADEDRKSQQNDVSKQIRQIFAKMQDIDSI